MDDREKEITLMLDQICRFLCQLPSSDFIHVWLTVTSSFLFPKAMSFDNATEVVSDLKEFATANEKRSYQYMETLLKTDSDVFDIVKAKVNARRQHDLDIS